MKNRASLARLAPGLRGCAALLLLSLPAAGQWLTENKSLLPIMEQRPPLFPQDEPLAAIEERLLRREGDLFPPEKKHRALRPLAAIERDLLRPEPVRRLVKRIAGEAEDAEVAGETDKADGEKAQILEFADGNRLHGTLEALDSAKKEIVWRGLDASAPIPFALAQISHLTFPAVAKVDPKIRATVKLTGGDWLAAEVTGLREGRVQLRLADGTALALDRTRIEWIYFAKGPAPECYEGPLSFAGWVTPGGWTYREGALRASQATLLGRHFEALPDRVEYRFEFDQGASFRAFGVTLHSADALSRNFGPGMVRFVISGTNLQFTAQGDENPTQSQVDLTKFLPDLAKVAEGGAQAAKLKALRCRIFEDRTAGQIALFINGKKVGDWKMPRSKPGENRGSFTFQPMGWTANSEQVLSKIRIAPWDGFVPVDDALEERPLKTDQALLADGETASGRLEGLTADKIKLGSTLLARENVVLLRLVRAEHPPVEIPAVGRVRLAQRGEFAVAALNFQDGRLQARTSFAGELSLPVAALREIELGQLPPAPTAPVDTLIFKNGDQLRGLLETAGSGQKLRWRAAAGVPPVEMDTARISGVLLAPRAARPAARLGLLARLRNGDLLSGDLVALERDNLLLENSAAGRVTLPRDRVQALYFTSAAGLPVLDGAAEREVWEAGIDLNRSVAEQRKRRVAEGKVAPSPWSYFDGAFAVRRGSTGNAAVMNNGGFNLGRVVEGLPARVEFSFDVLGGRKNQTYFTGYLFTETDNLGYILQFHQGGMYVYDAGRQQGARAVVQQLQIQFGEKVRADATQHRVRILADRPAGRMTLLVDGVVMGNFGPKAGAPPRNLGRGLALIPQQNMALVFANLWVAPWNGLLPGEAPAGRAPLDSVLLANGDETLGTVGTATPETLQIDAEVGPLDLPVNRLTMIEFGGRAAEPAGGVRLRLSDRSVLTVASYRIENDTIICQSTVAGELRIPLSALQELVFAQSAPPLPKTEEKPGSARPPGVILRGAWGEGLGGRVTFLD